MVSRGRKKHGLKILTLEEQQKLIDEMEPLSDLDAYAPPPSAVSGAEKVRASLTE